MYFTTSNYLTIYRHGRSTTSYGKGQAAASPQPLGSQEADIAGMRAVQENDTITYGV